MASKKNEGPTHFSVMIHRCYLCKYLNRDMQQSGRDPVYHNSCKHPDVVEHDNWGSSVRDIGYKDDTPTWCPFLSGDKK
jgi:hypothetical protein